MVRHFTTGMRRERPVANRDYPRPRLDSGTPTRKRTRSPELSESKRAKRARNKDPRCHSKGALVSFTPGSGSGNSSCRLPPKGASDYNTALFFHPADAVLTAWTACEGRLRHPTARHRSRQSPQGRWQIHSLRPGGGGGCGRLDAGGEVDETPNRGHRY